MSIENIVIKAESRQVASKGSTRNMRKAGYVPAVVYGKGGSDLLSIPVKALPKQHTRSQVIKLDISGNEKSVIMREAQVNVLTDEVIHIDFQEVAPTDAVKVKVPLEFVGLTREQEKEGSFKVLLRSVDVLAKAEELPASLQVKVGHLKADESAHISDIDLPAGVKVMAKRNLALASLVG